MTGFEIKKHRENKGWTQLFLAKKIGVGVRTIQNYENNGVVPESKHEILRNVFYSDSDEATNKKPKVTYLEKNGVKISLDEIAIFISKNENSMKTTELFRRYIYGVKKEAIIELYERNNKSFK